MPKQGFGETYYVVYYCKNDNIEILEKSFRSYKKACQFHDEKAKEGYNSWIHEREI